MSDTIAVVGAGASGLVAAIAAARRGAKVLLLERSHAIGRKVLASGGGKCNLSHARIAPERYHGESPDFIKAALSGAGREHILGLFEELGLVTETEPDGRIFPRSGQARSVVEVLEAELRRLGVAPILCREVTAIDRRDGRFMLKTAAVPVPWRKAGVVKPSPHPEEVLSADRVILSCGGAAHPQLGAGEGAYRLARGFGHTLTELTPALVPLCVKEGSVKRLQGLRAQAALTVLSGSQEIARSRGELLFTDFGLSGPAALDISREAVRHLSEGNVFCVVNLFPESSSQQLREFLSHRLKRMVNRPFKDYFTGLFPDKMGRVLVEESGLAPDKPAPPEALEKLAVLLEGWRFTLTAPRPWSEAMVTAGGVRTAEVDPKTFESRKRSGLYLTGELLDVDGDSGGFNLHFAWVSGLIAGTHAADQPPRATDMGGRR